MNYKIKLIFLVFTLTFLSFNSINAFSPSENESLYNYLVDTLFGRNSLNQNNSISAALITKNPFEEPEFEEIKEFNLRNQKVRIFLI